MYWDVLRNLKNKNTNMSRHITKAGQDFQDAMSNTCPTLRPKKWYQIYTTTQNYSASSREKGAS